VSVEALQGALRAEHAAIFGYGVAGAYLDGQVQTSARQIEMTHRDRRDQVSLRIQAQSGEPVSAEPAYELPFAVTDAPSAMRLAADLEEGAAGAWRDALAGTEGDDRQFALDALIACAVQATRWREAAGIVPTTVPFPGGTT
jgi:hypothetical protein